MTTKAKESSRFMSEHHLKRLVPGAGFEPATSGHRAFGHRCSPDYESGALARLGYPGLIFAELGLNFLVMGHGYSHFDFDLLTPLPCQ